MIVDIIGAALFFAAGVIVGLNGMDLWRLKKPIKRPMATKDDEMFLYGKHKMEWFWRRQYDKDVQKPISLKDYAKLRSET